MKKTYLVTGGAGFIGSHVVDRLIDDADADIICVDNLNDFYDVSIKQENIEQHFTAPNYHFYNIDISDYESLKKVFARHVVTHIVHLAARAGVRPSLLQPRAYVQSNITGTVNLLELAKEHDVKQFVYGSSSSVYGVQTSGPFHEKMSVNKPISPYAATKLAGEKFCYTYSHLYGIRVICLRFFTVYGPRQRPDLAIYKFSHLIKNGEKIPVFGDGTSCRDYTYVDDTVDGIIRALQYEGSLFEVINLGCAGTTRLDLLINLLEKNLQKKALCVYQKQQEGDVPLTYADISKAKSLLGYAPRVHIEDGLKRFTKWFIGAQK